MKGFPSSIRGQYATSVGITNSECQESSLLSRIDHRTLGISYSTGTCSLCSGTTLKDFGYSCFDCLFPIKLIMFIFFISVLSSSSLCSMSSTKMIFLLMIKLQAMGSHKRYPFTPLVYPKNMHFLNLDPTLFFLGHYTSHKQDT